MNASTYTVPQANECFVIWSLQCLESPSYFIGRAGNEAKQWNGGIVQYSTSTMKCYLIDIIIWNEYLYKIRLALASCPFPSSSIMGSYIRQGHESRLQVDNLGSVNYMNSKEKPTGHGINDRYSKSKVEPKIHFPPLGFSTDDDDEFPLIAMFSMNSETWSCQSPSSGKMEYLAPLCSSKMT